MVPVLNTSAKCNLFEEIKRNCNFSLLQKPKPSQEIKVGTTLRMSLMDFTGKKVDRYLLIKPLAAPDIYEMLCCQFSRVYNVFY